MDNRNLFEKFLGRKLDYKLGIHAASWPIEYLFPPSFLLDHFPQWSVKKYETFTC